MLWEKVSMFGVRMVIADVGTEFSQEGDRFLMQVFFEQGYSLGSLIRLNRVRIFWQVLFLSDILTALGKKIHTEIISQPRVRHKLSWLRWPTEGGMSHGPMPELEHSDKTGLVHRTNAHGMGLEMGRGSGMLVQI